MKVFEVKSKGMTYMLKGTSFSFATNHCLVIYDEGESVAAFSEYDYIIEKEYWLDEC